MRVLEALLSELEVCRRKQEGVVREANRIIVALQKLNGKRIPPILKKRMAELKVKDEEASEDFSDFVDLSYQVRKKLGHRQACN